MFSEIMQVVAAGIVIYGFRTWRSQLVGKRRFEIAEETVLTAHKVGDDLKWMRTDASLSSEAADRPREPGEAANKARQLDRYYIPLKRSQGANENFAALAKCRLLCTVHFGAETKEPFEKLYKARAKVIASAHTLTILARQYDIDSDRLQEQRRELEGKLWGTGDQDDQDVQFIESAVAKIEHICGPYLRPPDDLAWMKWIWSQARTAWLRHRQS